jgi:hypothetical protein
MCRLALSTGSHWGRWGARPRRSQGAYAPSQGQVHITGRDTLRAYEAALRQVAYRADEFYFLSYLAAAGNPLPRNVSVVVTDISGQQSAIIYRGFTVLGSQRMYSDSAAGRLVCTSKTCGGLGIYATS